jgi:light-regulated signal transduction histidine kinase (bacteriophytochrome)
VLGECATAGRGLHRPRDGLRQARRELTEANATLVARADKLARSNAELEQFAYVASHDLQEPLRTVASYTQLLTQRFGNAQGGDAAQFSGYITEGVHRMQGLIEGLLAYSRVAPDHHEFEQVNLTEVLGAVIQGLEGALSEAGGSVTYDPLPDVRANRAQMSQLFQNLIANAIKFRGQDPPRIHFSARHERVFWTFSVRDNGMGIAPQYAQRIFQLFQRLHTRDHIPGNGIGLAVCKKIVEHHGGRIWVEPGKPGSVFHFTLATDY